MRTDKTHDRNETQYEPARVRVIGKTADLVQGDYGQVPDMYRRYQPAPPPPPPPGPAAGG